MRFIENGPDIPNDLVEACDRGDVVFFCGAGVSRDAGVPGFSELTKKMITALGPEPESDIRNWFNTEHPHFSTPYADIYQTMQDEFGVEWVEHYLSKFLRAPRKPDTSNHDLILELSKNTSDKPQIITTNIDILFEKAWNQKSNLEIHQPPRLPDGSFSGMVYLHGKWKTPEPATTRKNYIFSTSDFGRAYLSEAWATQFIKDLLYTGKSIVFVGYSADDPPVKFLLQALHASDQHHSLYAFADFDEENSSPKHVEKGWKNKGVTVMPYPSGNEQQDHSALWKSLNKWTLKKRTPQKWQKIMRRLAMRSPSELKSYVRKLIVEWIKTPEGRNFFNYESESAPPAEWLSEIKFDPTDLSFWFSRILNDPLSSTWAAKQREIPQSFLLEIKRLLTGRNGGIPETSHNTWSLIHEAHEKNNLFRNDEIHCAISVLQQGTLTPLTLTYFNEALTPKVQIKERLLQHTSEKSLDTQIAKFEVNFPFHHHHVSRLDLKEIPDHLIPQTFRIFRYSLEQARIRITKIHNYYPASQIVDLSNSDRSRTSSSLKEVWKKTGQLFDLLATHHTQIAKAEMMVWPKADPIFFDKLKCYAFSRNAFTPKESCDGLLSLFDSALQNHNITSEWVHTLGERWYCFSTPQKSRFEKRICGVFPKPAEITSETSYLSWLSASALWELVRNTPKIQLTTETLEHIQQKIPDALKPAEDNVNSAFLDEMASLGITAEPSVLGCTLNDFEKLAKKAPLEALQFLKKAPHSNTIDKFWVTLALHDRNEHASDANRKQIAEAFLELSDELLASLNKFIPRWFSVHLKDHGNSEEALAWWDTYYNLLARQPIRFHEAEWARNHDHLSRNSLLHLSQSPIFMMTKCRLEIGAPLKLSKSRIECLLALESPAQQQSVCALANQLTELYALDAKWTVHNVLPHFSGSNSEAAWAGLLRDGAVEPEMPVALSSHLKDALLAAAPQIQHWRWQSNPSIAFAQLYVKMRSLIPHPETRQLLRYLGNEGRTQVIRLIAEEQNFWTTVLKPIIEHAWPKERCHKTPELSAAFAQMLMGTDKDFPEALKLTSPFLTHTQHVDLIDSNIISQHPQHFLALLNRITSDNPADKSWDLQQLLDKVVSVDSTLQRKPEWQRLNRIANAPAQRPINVGY